MDFLDIAKEMETQAIRIYTQLANDVPLPQLKGVFSVLADEEHRHLELFTAMQKNASTAPVDVNILVRARELLSKWDTGFRAPETLASYETAYRKGMDSEKEAVEFYSTEKTKISDPLQRKVLETIIDQEKRHIVLFENLIEFVRKPKQWVEDAEFGTLGDY